MESWLHAITALTRQAGACKGECTRLPGAHRAGAHTDAHCAYRKLYSRRAHSGSTPRNLRCHISFLACARESSKFSMSQVLLTSRPALGACHGTPMPREYEEGISREGTHSHTHSFTYSHTLSHVPSKREIWRAMSAAAAGGGRGGGTKRPVVGSRTFVSARAPRSSCKNIKPRARRSSAISPVGHATRRGESVRAYTTEDIGILPHSCCFPAALRSFTSKAQATPAPCMNSIKSWLVCAHVE